MEIEQIIKVSQLYDFYSELLSQKQKFEEKLNLIKLNNERLFILNEIRKLTDNEEILDYIEQLSKLEN